MENNNFKKSLTELEIIKNKAKSVQKELDESKRESLNLAENLAQQELETITNYSEQAAAAKIQAIQKVDSKSKSNADKFVQDWSKAFLDASSSAKDFGDIAQNVLSDLANRYIPDFLGNNSTGSMVFDLVTPLLGNLFGGFFAEGGRPDTGKVSVVGENGPELFVPDSAGTVLPNEGLSSQGVVVYQNFTFQSLDPATNMKLLQAQKDQIQTWVADGIKNNQNGLRSSVKSV